MSTQNVDAVAPHVIPSTREMYNSSPLLWTQLVGLKSPFTLTGSDEVEGTVREDHVALPAIEACITAEEGRSGDSGLGKSKHCSPPTDEKGSGIEFGKVVRKTHLPVVVRLDHGTTPEALRPETGTRTSEGGKTCLDNEPIWVQVIISILYAGCEILTIIVGMMANLWHEAESNTESATSEAAVSLTPQPTLVQQPSTIVPAHKKREYKMCEGIMRWREKRYDEFGSLINVAYSRGATSDMFNLHVAQSQLNGNNGEFTGSDDLDVDARRRARREARNHVYARAGQARRAVPLAREAQELADANHHRAQAEARAVAVRLDAPPGDPPNPPVPPAGGDPPAPEGPPNRPQGPGVPNGINPAVAALAEPDVPDDLTVESSVVDYQPGQVSNVICGTRKHFLIGAVVYRDDGGMLIPYDPKTCQWAGAIYDEPYRVVRPNLSLLNMAGDAGFYKPQRGSVVTTQSPFSVVRNFVIEARDHTWFKDIRIQLAKIGSIAMTVATLGYFDYWAEGPFRYLTKRKKDIMISMGLYSYLRSHKIASGITPDNVLLLARIAFRDFDYLPIEILIETLLFFTFQRGAAISEMASTTSAISSYTSKGKRFKAYREPLNTNVAAGDLIAGIDDITQEGWYRIHSEEEVKFWDSNNQTSITRLPYVPSDELHGDGNNRLKPPGYKFEMMEKFGFNKGATFLDPYVLFSTQDDDRVESKSYQTVGSCFATSMMVIDGKLTREVERCFLRLSMPRPDEEDLRRNQQWVVAPALLAGLRLAPNVDADITRRILISDPDYVTDQPYGPIPRLTPLQEIVRDSHLAYQSQGMDPGELADLIAHPIRAMHDYIDIIGGPKAAKRHRDVENYRMDPSVAAQKFNMIKFKPDEAQKYKFVNGKPVLKFGRATVSIEGMDWVLANPPMMYAMKHIIEREVKFERIVPFNPLVGPLNPAAGGTEITIDGVVTRSAVRMDYDLWYRAVLSETTNEQLAVIDQQMMDWVSAGPMRMAAVTHGDDIHMIKSDAAGKITAVEADISDNDGSYSDSLIRMEAQQVAVNVDPSACYAQLANPMLIINPSNSTEKLLVRSTRGMLRCSGGIGTTYGNSKGSFLVVLSAALNANQDISQSAYDVGFNVTHNEFSISRSCFLSTFVYYKAQNGVQVPKRMKCLASIARNFGRHCGDLPGPAKKLVSTRWKEYVQGVVKGYVNEPDTLFLRALRIKYDGWSLSSICSWVGSWSPTDTDLGVIRHYYPLEEQEQGLEEYLACVRLIRDSPSFGSVVACRFIDRIMSVRYGMAPIV